MSFNLNTSAIDPDKCVKLVKLSPTSSIAFSINKPDPDDRVNPFTLEANIFSLLSSLILIEKLEKVAVKQQ
jgi:hypothetical protein